MESTLFSAFGLPVTPYALCLVISLGIGLLCFFPAAKRNGVSRDAAWRAALLALPLGLMGARLFHFAGNYYYYEEVGFDALLRLWNGGFALWGAVGGAALAAFIAAKTTRQPAARLLDALAVPGALAIGLARFAEYFSGEGIGPYVENDLFARFPFAVYRPDYEVWNWAVFMLEGVSALVIAVILMRRKRPAGDTARLFLLLYSACQITLESLRRDHCLRWLFVRVSQLTCLLVILGLMLFAGIRWFKSKKKASPLPVLLPWLAVALCSGIIIAVEFSFDGKILRDLPVWAGYLIMACCSAGIGYSAYRALKLFDLKA
ncbi:MAG: prolipoprotein diacylglyceryl transferase [Clostridia bacterium]|nr:prolipoprotein diacylglyceryl transferase [Clostridia bacterium]